MLNIHIYFKWSSFIYKWLYNDAESNTYIWISMFTVISMANNCLVRAIFHPPTHPPPLSTSVYHTILRQDLDIISYCFRNEYLEFQNFHNILHNAVPISTKFKIYYNIQHGCLPHLQTVTPKGDREPSTGNYRNKKLRTWRGSWSPLWSRYSDPVRRFVLLTQIQNLIYTKKWGHLRWLNEESGDWWETRAVCLRDIQSRADWPDPKNLNMQCYVYWIPKWLTRSTPLYTGGCWTELGSLKKGRDWF